MEVQDETWHRVRIGPLSDLSKINGLRDKLAQHKLHAIVIHAGN